MTSPVVRSGLDAFPALGAVVLQAPVVKSPLPGGVASVVRFFLNTVPQWVQIAGVFVALVVATWLAAYVWRRRVALREWLVTRQRAVKIALLATVALLAVGFTAFGTASWNYIQHDNGFCTGCHVMGPAYQRFVESEHGSLSCHDCHQQSIFASTRQLYLWVAERPEKIGPHARLPDRVCERCHVTGDAKKKWQRIATTAGHRAHLESDSSALRDVQCVTCHALEVHHFAPVDSTCGQASCHVNVEMRIAKMRDQTNLHCVTCHQFTADVPRLATRDSASGTLVPGMKQCFSCHEMRKVIATFDPERDPHNGTCGMCHNPHTQATPTEAAKRCTTAGCHDTWRREPFHTGANHRAVTQNCTLCHQPHAARVDASDCAGCHRALQGRREHGRTLRPPLPFDTTKALRRTSELSTQRVVFVAASSRARATPLRHSRARRRSAAATLTHASSFTTLPGGRRLVYQPPTPDLTPPSSNPVPSLARSAAFLADSFRHEPHKRLACITCHTSGRQAGKLTFQPPRGCQICHHQAPRTSSCAECHQPREIAAPLAAEVRISVTGHASRPRAARFEHPAHAAIACVDCHTTPVSLAPAPPTAACQTCHEDHHTADRQCAACHAIGKDSSDAGRRSPHAPPADTHTGCDACHSTTTVARLTPDRPMCLTCHAPQREHYADRQCTTCHVQSTPDAFRRMLIRRTGS